MLSSPLFFLEKYMHPEAESRAFLREQIRQRIDEPKLQSPTADAILQHVADIIAQRGAQRDSPDGERSMYAAVQIFHKMTGTALTEKEGWQFMVALKLARMKCNRGPVNHDDYLDAIAYLALTLEHITQE